MNPQERGHRANWPIRRTAASKACRASDPDRSGNRTGEEGITTFGQEEVLFTQSTLIVGCQVEGHLIPANVNIGVVVCRLSDRSDSVDESDGAHEPLKLECSRDVPRGQRPLGNRLQPSGYFPFIHGR